MNTQRFENDLVLFTKQTQVCTPSQHVHCIQEAMTADFTEMQHTRQDHCLGCRGQNYKTQILYLPIHSLCQEHTEQAHNQAVHLCLAIAQHNAGDI